MSANTQTSDAFIRVEQLLGSHQTELIRSAHVMVAGLGAVGSFATEALARSGVGRLTLIDFDVIHPSNVNRQLYALHSSEGHPKTEIARQRVLDINPACEINALELFIDNETAPAVLDEASPDILIDAIDSLNPKTALLEAAHHRTLPTIASMGAATRLDPCAIEIADISETHNCPLARFVRRRLRKRGIQEGICCIFSTEPPTQQAIETTPDDEERVLDRGLPRKPLGSLCPVPGIFGLTAAAEAIRLIRTDLQHQQKLPFASS